MSRTLPTTMMVLLGLCGLAAGQPAKADAPAGWASEFGLDFALTAGTKTRQFSGRMHLEPLQGGAVLVTLQALDAVHVSSSTDELVRPFEVYPNAGCGVARIGFDPKVQSMARSWLAQIVASLGLWGDVVSRRCIEQDALGQRVVRYEVNDTHVVRRVLTYTSIHAKPSMPGADLSSHGGAQFVRDERGLREATVESGISFPEASGPITLLFKGRLKRTSTKRVPLEAPKWAPRPIWAHIGAKGPPAPPLDPRTVLAGLNTHLNAGLADPPDVAVVKRMAQLLRESPDQSKALITRLLPSAADPLVAKLLAAVLGRAGTPEAITALAQILVKSPAHSALARRTEWALSETEATTEGALQILLAASRGGEGSERFLEALGRLAGRSPDSPMGRAAIDHILSRMESAHWPYPGRNVLNAVAATAHPRALPALARALEGKDEGAHMTAASALGRIEGSAAATLLEHALLTNRAPKQVIWAIGQRGPDPAGRALLARARQHFADRPALLKEVKKVEGLWGPPGR